MLPHKDVARNRRVDATHMRVRYSPRIARWIAERERLAEEADGSVAMDVPV